MADLFEKFESHRGNLGNYADKAEGYFMFPKLEGEIGSRMKFNGKECIIWSVNDYLGLANNKEVRRIDADSAERWGLAYPMGSRMMTGNTDYHERLERMLADFVEKEESFVLNYGYQGFMSVIDSLVSRHDVIVHDSEIHACLVDGVRLHQGKRYAYNHNDIKNLKEKLERASLDVARTNGGILVITEGVYGMRGDQGNLKEICKLKDSFNFRLLVDDAHGFGTMGDKGRGTGIHQNCQDGIDIYLATFAKAMAGIGGFVAADKKVVEYLKYLLRSQIFAKALPMAVVEGAMKRLEMIKKDNSMQKKLWGNVNFLQKSLRENGLEIGNTNTPVTPIYLEGTVEEAMALVYDLRETYNIFCSIVVPPVVPQGMMILRLIPTASHSRKEIEATIAAFKIIKENLQSGKYSIENIKSDIG